MKIDAHHHFWKYHPVKYPWMTEKMAAIRKDFLPEDFEKIIQEAEIEGVVSVQARQDVEETAWLLSLAARHDFIKGVVGWVPLVEPSVGKHLETLAADPKLKGVRHILQDEPDDFYMLREDFNAGIRELRRFGLVYDILIYERHLPQTIQFVDRNPDQMFVLDHIAKPKIKDRVLSPWNENIVQLAKRENVYCKLSGMATEADWRAWTPQDLRPYLEVVLSAFGPKRLMFASDWPVMLLAAEYKTWTATVLDFTSALSSSEQARILGGTAIEAYRL